MLHRPLPMDLPWTRQHLVEHPSDSLHDPGGLPGTGEQAARPEQGVPGLNLGALILRQLGSVIIATAQFLINQQQRRNILAGQADTTHQMGSLGL